MPWNEEIRASWGSIRTPGGQPRDRRSHAAVRGRIECAGGPSDSPRANPVLRHTDDPVSCPRRASMSLTIYRARNTLSFQGATCTTSLNRAPVVLGDLRVPLPGTRQKWPTIGFSPRCFHDIVDSTAGPPRSAGPTLACVARRARRRRPGAARTLSRPRGEHIGDGFLAMFDGLASDPLRDVDPRRGAGARHRGARRVVHRRVRGPRRCHRRDRRARRARARERTGRAERRARVQHAARPRDRVRTRVRGARRTSSRACPANGASSPSPLHEERDGPRRYLQEFGRHAQEFSIGLATEYAKDTRRGHRTANVAPSMQ